MNIIHSVVLGVVEGLTEFLPISSTFHLIFTSKILGLADDSFLKMFEVVIQSGAISALLFIYLHELMTSRQKLVNVIMSFVPTALVGLALHSVIKSVFFEAEMLMLSVFVLVGLLFLWVESLPLKLTKELESLTITQAILIGLVQSLSVIPGVSRSGSVIIAMMLMGFRREESAKYTFLLSLPTIFAASALDLYQGREFLTSSSSNYMLLATGFLTALIVAYFVVKWLINYLSNHTLKIFGWYRLVVAVIILLFMGRF